MTDQPQRPDASPPLPQSRTLSQTLRRQLSSGEGLRLLVGEALDPTGIDQSYTPIRLAGQDYVIPKLDGPQLQIPMGRAVYVLADESFNSMIAIGSVRG